MEIKERNDKFVSLQVLIDRVMTWPLMDDLPLDVAIRTVIDTIRDIGNKLFLKDVVAYLTISDYRVELPDNVVDIIKVVHINGEDALTNRTSMKITSDPFFSSYTDRNVQGERQTIAYKIQGKYLYTNFEEGKVQVAYTCIPLDSDGIVMVPDRSSIIKAMEYSIIREWYARKWISKKIDYTTYKEMDKEKMWYIGKASTDFMLENIDKRESLSNIVNTLLNNNYLYNSDFRGLGDKEFRRIHR